MNEQEINAAKKTYRARRKEINKLEDAKAKIKNLVLHNQKNYSLNYKKEILTEAFRKYGLNTHDSKKIYVFMGSYTYEDSPIGYRLSILENPPWEYFNKYIDIETEEVIKFDKKEISKFEKNNIILKSKIPISFVSPNAYQSNFYIIQQKYYQMLNYIPQDKAIKYIKTRTKIPLQRKKTIK